MYSTLICLIIYGFIQLQFQAFVLPCSSNRNEVIEFCSGRNISGSNIYLNLSAASTRITNCTCLFTASSSREEDIHIHTGTNNATDCNIIFFYGYLRIGNMHERCNFINSESIRLHTYSTLKLILVNLEDKVKNYCINLKPVNDSIKLIGTCLSDHHISTTSTTSTSNVMTSDNSITKTKRTAITSEKDTSTYTTTTETKQETTHNVVEKKPVKGLPFEILIPAVVGGVFLILVILMIVVSIRCKSGAKKTTYEESEPKTNSHSYNNQNQAYVNDDDGDDMRDNELYHSRNLDSGLQDITVEHGGGYAEVGSRTNTHRPNTCSSAVLELGGGYAEVQSPGHSNKTNTNKNSLPSFQTEQNHHSTSEGGPPGIEGGPVYSMPVKKQKHNTESENNIPVYAMPDKKKKKHHEKEDIGPVYAMPDKKNKKAKNTKSMERNASKTPPAVSPKPVINIRNSSTMKGTVNQDGLHYSDLEFDVSSNSVNNANLNLHEKTGYAEVL